MAYDIELIRKQQCPVSTWSGGTTTQLAIYPKEAAYSERNFKWRLSSATVEVEESVFTSLPNTNRVIMVIKGKLILEHEGHHKSILESFDQDCFSGNWCTKGFGKVTDFNLMMGEGCEGELEAIHLEKEQCKSISLDNNEKFLEGVEAIYCVNGQVKVGIPNGDMIAMGPGDIILVTYKDTVGDLKLKIINDEEDKTDLIRANIHY